MDALRLALADAGADHAGIAEGIVAARALAEAASREAVLGVPLDTASEQFRRYLVMRLGSRREEAVLVLFFNADGIYIAEDLYAGGRRAECLIPLRRTVRRAFDLDARRLVLAHNHPSGSSRPSSGDIAATLQFRAVVEALEIALEDHCVVAGNHVSSMKSLGMV